MKDAPILILDDSLSAVDVGTVAANEDSPWRRKIQALRSRVPIVWTRRRPPVSVDAGTAALFGHGPAHLLLVTRVPPRYRLSFWRKPWHEMF